MPNGMLRSRMLAGCVWSFVQLSFLSLQSAGKVPARVWGSPARASAELAVFFGKLLMVSLLVDLCRYVFGAKYLALWLLKYLEREGKSMAIAFSEMRRNRDGK